MKFLYAFLLPIFITFSYAQNISQELFHQADLIDAQMNHLLKKSGKNSLSWQGHYQGFDKPSFSFYKTLQLFHKLNDYRLKKGFGAIAIPSYPNKKITELELFELLNLFNQQLFMVSNKTPRLRFKSHAKSFNTLYSRLSHIQESLNILIEYDGGTPTDVYKEAQYILESIKALRTIQGQMNTYSMPKRKTEQLSNHSLAAAQSLLKQVQVAKKNLWIPTSTVNSVPKRMIRPNDVKNSLDKVYIELQDIKHRLGIQTKVKRKAVKGVKYSSDVVQVLEFAKKLMPQFKLQSPITQKRRINIDSTYNSAISIALLIQNRLQGDDTYKYLVPSDKISTQFEANHYYFMLRESFILIQKIRRKVGLKISAMPDFSKECTALTITRLLQRLDSELNIITYKKTKKVSQDWDNLEEAPYDDDTLELNALLEGINKDLKERYKLTIDNYDLYTASYILEQNIKTLVEKVNFYKKPKKNILLTPENVYLVTLNHMIFQLHSNLFRVQSRANIPLKPLHLLKDEPLNVDYLFRSLMELNNIVLRLSKDFDVNMVSQAPIPAEYSFKNIYYKLSQSLTYIHMMFQKR